MAAAKPAKNKIDLSGSIDPAKQMSIAPYRALQWSEDGSTVFFGLAPHEPQVAAERRAPGELPPARVQVWHYKDVRQFHQQEVNAAQDRQRTTLAAWHPGQSSIVRLTTDPYENVQVGASGNVIVALDQSPYFAETNTGRAADDVYLVDPNTGKRTKVLTKTPFGLSVSPTGRVALYQQNGQWWAMDLASNARTNVSSKINTSLVNVEDDHPVPERRAYGLAGVVNGE